MPCLSLCKAGSQRGRSEVRPSGRDRDRDGVHRPFDENCLAVCCVADDVELVALVEERGLAGVQVLGPVLAVVGVFGVAASDEAEDLAVVGDGEHDAVSEAVDQLAGGRGGRDAGCEHLVVGDALAVEVADQGRPAVWRVAGADARVAGDVLPEPLGEVGLGPAPG